MCARIYVLIDAADERADEMLATLRHRPGITQVDRVEGPPDIIMIMEADEVRELATMTVQAMASVEHLTSGIQCLPVNDNERC